ncbi:MAG: amidohydrolase [Chloroflexota bacterium]
MSLEAAALSYLDAKEESLSELAKDIWDHPELGLQEYHSSRLISDELEKAGFSVEMGVAQMPTAFVASWGEGGPIIGILGEYDALPGLSQQVSAAREPVEDGAPGHGCGHNLLGVASLGAALAAKEAMERDGISGTIRYYGCPAEETLLGKIFMAQAGLFDDLDAVIAWHPGYVNSVQGGVSTLAMNSFKVNFHGVAAHAGAAPHAGRSALDGVILMDVGVNYLREHVIPEATIHGVITEGGEAPNIVPPYAQVWYFVRAPRREQVDDIYARMLDIAKGAALMTGTTHDVEFLTGCYALLANDVIGGLMLEKMNQVGGPGFTDQDRDFARRLQRTLPPGAVEMGIEGALKITHAEVTKGDLGDPLCEKIIGPRLEQGVMPYSTDVGDVSHIAPTGSLSTCCHALGTPLHSWQYVAATGSGIGFKAMMLAARTMALTMLDLIMKPDALKASRAELEEKTGGKQYASPLPGGAAPH